MIGICPGDEDTQSGARRPQRLDFIGEVYRGADKPLDTTVQLQAKVKLGKFLWTHAKDSLEKTLN